MALGVLGIALEISEQVLYTLKTVLQLSGDKLDQTVVLGILSLLIWARMLITSVKYITVGMRIDNDAEGYAYPTWLIFWNFPFSQIIPVSLESFARMGDHGGIRPPRPREDP